MGDIKPQALANKMLVECSMTENLVKIEVAMYEVLCNVYVNKSDEERWEYIERYKSDIATEFFRKKDDSYEDGAPLSFSIEDDHGDFYVRFNRIEEVILLQKLQQILPRDFEVFCAEILKKMNGISSATGGSSDNGIDFQATDLRLCNMPSSSTLGSRVLVIGQAKRYTDGNHVTLKELREFVGASLRQIYEHKKDIGNTVGILHPIVLAFWTTSDFHPEAKRYAKDMGIWYLNGLALCKFAKDINVNLDQFEL